MNSNSSDSGSETEHQQAQKEKFVKKRKFIHKYQAAWKRDEKFKLWVKPSKKGDQFFFCAFCSNDYKCKKSDLIKHMKSTKHSNNAATTKSRRTLDQLVASSTVMNAERRAKENEIRIGMCLVEHNLSFNIVDHLVNLIKNLNLDSEVVKKCHVVGQRQLRL